MDGDIIRLTIPAEPGHTRLPRVAIAGLATRAGFSFDEVEELRLAIGEVCQVLVDGEAPPGDPPTGELVVTFTVQRGSMEVAVTLEGGPAVPTGSGAHLSEQILAATTDSVEVAEGGRRITFRKSAAEE